MNSKSEPATETSQQPTPGARVPATNWAAHLALILAAAAAAAIVAGRGGRDLLRVSSIVILVVMVLIFAAQIITVRRARGALGNGIAYGLCAAGAACMLAAQFAAAGSLFSALTILSGVLFASGIVAFVLQIRGIGRLQ